MYGFDYSDDTLSVPFQDGVSTENMSATQTSSITAGRQVLNNCEKGFLLDDRHCLEAMWQLHAEGDVGWI